MNILSVRIFDTEGSTIGYNILRFICDVKDGKRMKFSTLTKDELLESYNKMSEHFGFWANRSWADPSRNLIGCGALIPQGHLLSL